MSGDFSADRLSATIPPVTDSERELALRRLTRMDALDCREILGLDIPQPDRTDPDRSRPRHHQNHIFASARRIA